MPQVIKLKRSATASATPTTAQLELGEIAINTFDGRVFFKKDDGTESIKEISASEIGEAASLSFGPTAPTLDVATGDLWYDTTELQLKAYNGASWKTVGARQEATEPASASEGDLWFDTTKNKLLAYDGSVWNTVGSTSSTTAPTGPSEGDLWFDTTNDKLKAWDGTDWITVGSTSSVAQPTSAQEGDLWYDQANDQLKAYNGTSWVEVGYKVTDVQVTNNLTLDGAFIFDGQTFTDVHKFTVKDAGGTILVGGWLLDTDTNPAN
jgi:hypothetical protein